MPNHKLGGPWATFVTTRNMPPQEYVAERLPGENVLVSLETTKNGEIVGRIKKIADDGVVVSDEIVLMVGRDPDQPSLPMDEAVKSDDFTDGEWDAVKRRALEQIGANNLDKPEAHLTYIRERIKAAVARNVQ